MNIDLWEIVKNMFLSLLGDIVNGWLHDLQTAFGNIIQTAFYIEDMPGLTAGILTSSTVDGALGVMYLSTVGLLVLKLCWKGYKVYVLWRDGDAEVSPFSLLTSSIFALTVALVFPILYDIAITIAMSVSNSILREFPGVSATNLFTVIISFLTPWLQNNVSILLVLLVLIFVIVCVILAIQMIVRGVEMLIYRLGVPLAVVGLVDSDGGIWKSYIQLFFRQLATIMIQYFCISIAVRLAATLTVPTLIGAIVFLIAAFKMPKLLASILSSGGGGGSGVMYTAMIAARAFAGGG